jgi:hypothetical protein
MYITFFIFISENPNLKLTIDNRTIMVSWKDHFSTQQPIYYEVSAGTTLGGADIIQWQETQNSFLEFELPLKIKSITLMLMNKNRLLYYTNSIHNSPTVPRY